MLCRTFELLECAVRAGIARGALRKFGVCDMSIVPKNLVSKIEFFEDHLAAWAANAVAMGSSAAKVTALQTKTTAARAALVAQREAKIAAKGKTLLLSDAVREMANAGGDIIKEVKVKAANDGSNVPYELAGIPGPATPSPVAAPGTPFDFLVLLIAANGALQLKWKCTNPPNGPGVYYSIERRLGGGGSTGSFVLLGTSGARKYTDATVPAGTTRVTYRITATRTTGAGNPATFEVQFGVGGAGEMTASVLGGGPTEPKLAA